jgi:prevent-host-death family protein
MQISVRELKNHLSEYLRRAQSGEEFVVTSHGRPVGRLTGPDHSIDRRAETLARLRAQPWVRPGKGGRVRGARRPIKAGPNENLSQTLLERE